MCWQKTDTGNCLKEMSSIDVFYLVSNFCGWLMVSEIDEIDWQSKRVDGNRGLETWYTYNGTNLSLLFDDIDMTRIGWWACHSYFLNFVRQCVVATQTPYLKQQSLLKRKQTQQVQRWKPQQLFLKIMFWIDCDLKTHSHTRSAPTSYESGYIYNLTL